jgi:hypothetical protein
LLSTILTSCIHNASILVFDIPFGLITRLILTDDGFVESIIDQLNNSNEVEVRVNTEDEDEKLNSLQTILRFSTCSKT